MKTDFVLQGQCSDPWQSATPAGAWKEAETTAETFCRTAVQVQDLHRKRGLLTIRFSWSTWETMTAQQGQAAKSPEGYTDHSNFKRCRCEASFWSTFLLYLVHQLSGLPQEVLGVSSNHLD